MRLLLALIGAALLWTAATTAASAQADVRINCYAGSTVPMWQPCSSTIPFPITTTVVPWNPTPLTNAQYGLAVTTNTTLTVPTGSRCAQISVETANIRFDDTGAGATTTSGQIAYVGQQYQYCGSLSALKFTAVSGSPTINVSYYR